MKTIIAMMLIIITVGCQEASNNEDDQETVEAEELVVEPPSPFARIDGYIEANRFEEALVLVEELKVTNPELEADCQTRIVTIEERLEEIELAAIAAAEAAEQARQASIDEAASIIRIVSMRTSRPNSAGGVDLFIHWQNTSDQTIRYATFTVQAYNAVDDPVQCTIRNRDTQFRGQVTGPIEPGQHRGNDGTRWSCAWYNSTISYGKITRVEIEYMDRSTVTVSGTYLIY